MASVSSAVSKSAPSPESFAALFEESLTRKEMRVGEVITAEVIRVDANHVVVNAGLKSESYIPADEFKSDRGEIEVKGATVMLGYWKRPVATSETIRDGWLHTGDLGRVDDEGYLYVVDRRDDLIITGGENVYPAEVENALMKHPAVQDVAVIGIRPCRSNCQRSCQWPKLGKDTIARRPIRKRCFTTSRGWRVACNV